MTQQEHLNRIRARCVELLSIWDHKRDHDPLYTAACGKEAEAGWKATIAAIDNLESLSEWKFDDLADGDLAEEIEGAINRIIASWPEELL